MKYTSLFIGLILSIIISSCSQESKEILISARKGIVDTIQSENYYIDEFSIEEISYYEGILPCDNCPGIETKIILYPNNKYERSSIYRETDFSEITEKGSYKWNPSNSIIKLENSKIYPSEFILNENQMRIYNNSNNKNQDNYILIKK